ncbi:AhpC/TSA family protein [Antarcticibacterium arcticum]|uniref:AhpC/TSA family protein n=1 Tax=Antarcticibacterium arcticum TaxID=2585771 RepID=A0A5B8YJD9_9FLAO|nr:TlpA disulfide reductase family protein [Antarcticibacterium arcticum]QED36496.1 AhpC/TSA family protein [Antarcticibacterium arcticum]
MKYLFLIVLSISLTSCQEDTNGYAISGNVKNLENGKMIYVSSIDQNNQPQIIDSVLVENEKFSLDLAEVEVSGLSFLTIKGVNGNVMFISENEPIKFEIYKDSLDASKVSGGKENQIFYEYLNHLKGLNQEMMQLRMEMQQMATTSRDPESMARFQQKELELRERDMVFKKKMIKENPAAYVSVLVLTDMQSMGASTSELKEHYEMLSEEMKQLPLAKSLKSGLDKRSAVEIGSKAPRFTGPDPAGNQLALEDLMGKVTLIDFWAAWCRPCRIENPNIVRIYNKYHDHGFNIIGVSLDRGDQRDRWLQAIEEDKLTWPQISNLQFWDEPIAQLYGVRAIPAAFILDENGVIVATNLRGDDLENKVKELLEK